ncbi:MAG: NAD-dependent epimerase/dehydratase family protein [Planctomycetaceae bacterium]|jgi:nucleoside-diphosphate-sugar epimerase|nr:NAD-dependent epimerase/dehydratase family protein [Planctomycetaceae bacterium]
MRTLVTGGSGFIGYHLVRRLRDLGDDVRCLVRQGSDVGFIDSLSVEFVYGDLRDVSSLERAVKGCDVVYHLAGRVRAISKRDFWVANCDGTKNLLNASIKSDSPPAFVYVSSIAAAGPSGNNLPKVETDVSLPITDYGLSKLSAERVIADFCDRLPCSIVRPAIVFGGADKMNLELYKTIKKLGICPVPGWRNSTYSWIHATDLVELLILTAKSGERVDANVVDQINPTGKGLYFAAADEGTKLSDVGKMIGKSLGKRRTLILHCPPLTVLTLSTFYEIKKFLTGKNVPYDWSKATESKNNWCCSTKKAETQLNFKVTTPIETRIHETTNWYTEHKWL